MLAYFTFKQKRIKNISNIVAIQHKQNVFKRYTREMVGSFIIQPKLD